MNLQRHEEPQEPIKCTKDRVPFLDSSQCEHIQAVLAKAFNPWSDQLLKSQKSNLIPHLLLFVSTLTYDVSILEN